MPLPNVNPVYYPDAVLIAKAIDNLVTALKNEGYSTDGAMALAIAYIRSER
jgi:hypothetical protein